MATSDTPSAEESSHPASHPAQPVVSLQATADETPDDQLEVGASETDSAYGGSDVQSDTTSISSAIFEGYLSNGRRYQTLKEGYWGPSDSKQFSSMNAGHLLHLIINSGQTNPLFRAPISRKAQQVLDIGTGDGAWALDVADRFPNLTVHGVDLYPPPHDWVPPNCILEVDDVNKPWTWTTKFDLIHMRHLNGAFTAEEWKTLYQQAFDNLTPGGWLEHIEPSILMKSDDGSLPADSNLAAFGPLMSSICDSLGKSANSHTSLNDLASSVGFTNIELRSYKMPLGAWPKTEVWRHAGMVNEVQWKEGVEGGAMFLLTQIGEPGPTGKKWNADEVKVLVAKMKSEIGMGWSVYQEATRIWCQKPF